MRVLIDYRPALRERTGVGEYTHELVKALCEGDRPRTLDLTIFSSSWSDRLRLDDPGLRGVRAVDRRVPVRLLNFAWHRLGWPPAEALTGRTFDVTHSLHPLLLPSRTAAQVITIHDLSFLESRDVARPTCGATTPRSSTRMRPAPIASSCSSQYAASEIERRLNVPREKIAVCPPGAPDWPARTHGAMPGYMLFVGTLERRKNVGALLDAYERLLSRPPKRAANADARAEADATRRLGALPELVLAGKATTSSRRVARADRTSAAARASSVTSAMSTADRRRALYEGARLLVLPSFEEGFGLPVLEAMTIGVPVIASNRGALPEVVGDAGPLIEPNDPEELAAAIEHLLERRGVRGGMRIEGPRPGARIPAGTRLPSV